MAIIKDLSGNGVGAEIDNMTYRKGFDYEGNGSPEGVVSATVGSRYRRRDGGANTSLYIKESGTGNTGWVAK